MEVVFGRHWEMNGVHELKKHSGTVPEQSKSLTVKLEGAAFTRNTEVKEERILPQVLLAYTLFFFLPLFEGFFQLYSISQ